MPNINRKDIVAINLNFLELYPGLVGQNGQVISATATNVVVENAAGAKINVEPEHLDVIKGHLDYPLVWAEHALKIFQAILEGKSIERHTAKDGWKAVKHPELISLDKLLDDQHRIAVEPTKEQEIITLNGIRYQRID